jgi:MFS family permease
MSVKATEAAGGVGHGPTSTLRVAATGAVAGSRWRIVAASLSGMTAGSAAISIFGFSVLLKPLAAELGLSRGELSLGVAMTSTLTAISSLFVGYLMDRFGVRRIMIPGILLFAAATAAYGFVPPGEAWLIYLVFLMSGLATAAQQPIGYAKMISLWFDHRRGLALGIALAGVGLGAVVMPQIAGFMDRQFGLQPAFAALGASVLLFAFLPVFLSFREPTEQPLSDRTSSLTPPKEGYDLWEALRQSTFWRLNAALLLAVCAINGTLTHMVSMLTDRGLAPAAATNVLSVAGVFIIFGRIASGWLLDRFRGQFVAAFFVACPMIGLGLLLSGAKGMAPVAGGILCGLGIGAEVDLIAFFLGRYFGVRAMATLFGTAAAVLALATAAGPYIMGLVFDRARSYAPALVGFELALLVALLLFVTLGPYRFKVARD